MSKNLTRKGLAFGAILALGSSLFAGTAAHAADELTLAPSAGTSYNTIEGENFTLLTGLAPTTPAGNTVQLKYSVTTTATLGTMSTAIVNGTAAATTAVAGAAGSNTTVYKLTSGTPTVGAAQKLVLASPASIASGTPATATVTAFFDANSNDVLDSGEYSSAARTVKWSDAADVTATVTLTSPSQGDLKVKATVALADVNQEQISENHLAFYITAADGTTMVGGLTASATDGSSVYSGTSLVAAAALASGSYSLNQTVTALGSTGGVKVAVYYLATASGASSFLSGASKSFPTNAVTGSVLFGSSTKAITARTLSTITAAVAATANNSANTGTGANAAGTPGAAAADVRKNNEVTITATLKDATPAAIANIPVTVTATATSFISTDAKSVSINGTSYATSALLAAATATVTSDASGVVTVKVNTTGFVDGNSVVVTLAAQGYSTVVTLTSKDAVFTLVRGTDLTTSTNRSVVKGETITASYTLVDQFKQIPATGEYRLVATAGSVTTSGITAGATYVPFAAGKASVSYTPTGVGTFTLTPSVELKNATTLNWGNPAQGALALAAVTVNVIAAQTDAVTATVAYNSGARTTAGSALVADKAEKAVDTRLSFDTANSYSADETVTVSGVISQDITGAVRPGALVTVSGAGLLFSAGSQYYADSISLYADATTAAYSVTVYSNIAGTYTVTVASGNATKTATVKFASTLAAATVVLGDLPAQAQAGRAVDLSATLKDKYGNVATTANNVTFTVTGAGYVQTTTAVAASATTGVATNRLIVLGQDLGTANVSASIVDPADSTKTIAASKSVEFGLTDADVTVGGRAVYASVEFAKGKTVTVSVDGKRLYSKLFSTDAYTELKFTQKTAGKHTVTVRVSGGIVYSEVVTTTK